MLNSDANIAFYPTRQRGSFVLGGLLVLFGILASLFFWLAAITPIGWMFALYLAGGIVACTPFPMLIYRLIALNRAYYLLERNSLTLHWGLRTEILPLHQIEWFRPLTDLTSNLTLPPIPLPGAYIGVRMVEGLSKVEYMADSFENGLMIATPETVYVISPSDMNGFLASFHRWIEMGSLEYLEPQSIQPAFVLGKLWDDRLARILILVSFGLGILLSLWVIALITSVPSVVIGSNQTVQEIARVPSIRLLLYPILFGFIFVLDLIGGTFFYRREDQKHAAYLLWAGGVISPILLILSVFLTTIQL